MAFGLPSYNSRALLRATPVHYHNMGGFSRRLIIAGPAPCNHTDSQFADFGPNNTINNNVPWYMVHDGKRPTPEQNTSLYVYGVVTAPGPGLVVA